MVISSLVSRLSGNHCLCMRLISQQSGNSVILWDTICVSLLPNVIGHRTSKLHSCLPAILMTSPSFRQVSIVMLPVFAVLVNVCMPLDVAWSWSNSTVASFLVTQFGEEPSRSPFVS